MNTNLLQIVKQITAQYGENVLADPARLKAFFSDLAKDEPKPLRIAFGRCIESGAYTALKAAPDAAERASRKAVIAQRVRDEHGLDAALCAEALDVLEAALYGPARAAYTPPPYQQPQSYHHQPSYPPPNYAAPPPTHPPQSTSFQTSPGNISPVLAAKKNTIGELLVAAGVLVVIFFIATNWGKITNLGKIILVKPQVEHFINLGKEHYNNNEFDLAVSVLSEALRIDPNNAYAYLLRGAIYVEKKLDFDRAIVDSTEAIRLNPNDERAYYIRGLAYYGKGQRNQAIQDCEKALRINPDNSDAKDILRLVRGW